MTRVSGSDNVVVALYPSIYDTAALAKEAIEQPFSKFRVIPITTVGSQVIESAIKSSTILATTDMLIKNDYTYSYPVGANPTVPILWTWNIRAANVN